MTGFAEMKIALLSIALLPLAVSQPSPKLRGGQGSGARFPGDVAGADGAKLPLGVDRPDRQRPCPPQEVLDRINKTIDELNCDPDLEWDGRFPGNFTAERPARPCPPQEVLDRINKTIDELNCDPDLEWEGRFPGNFTSIECQEPVICSIAFNKTGVVVCRLALSGDESFDDCIHPDMSREGDECGCCGGSCPQPCTCECTTLSGHPGVLMENEHLGFERCFTPEQSVTKQLNDRYKCVETCP